MYGNIERLWRAGALSNVALRALIIAGVLFAITAGRTDAANAPEAQDRLWSRQCVPTPQGGEACFVQQFVMAQPQHVVLLKIIFSYLGAGNKPRVEFTTPLNVLLPPGLTIKVDDRKPITVPFSVCDQGGCRTTIDMDDKALKSVEQSKTLTVRYVTADRNARDLPVLIEGWDKAMESIAP